jgi:Arc/MetJ-type ribon-helix-helix transcriptional regulator
MMSDKGEKNKKTVYLSTELYNQIAERIKTAGFNSVDEYVAFVMEEVLKDDEDEAQAVSKEDEEEVKKRLKALGYIE